MGVGALSAARCARHCFWSALRGSELWGRPGPVRGIADEQRNEWLPQRCPGSPRPAGRRRAWPGTSAGRAGGRRSSPESPCVHTVLQARGARPSGQREGRGAGRREGRARGAAAGAGGPGAGPAGALRGPGAAAAQGRVEAGGLRAGAGRRRGQVGVRPGPPVRPGPGVGAAGGRCCSSSPLPAELVWKRAVPVCVRAGCRRTFECGEGRGPSPSGWS